MSFCELKNMIHERQLSMRCFVVKHLFRFFVFQLENSSTGKPFVPISVRSSFWWRCNAVPPEPQSGSVRSVSRWRRLVNSQRFPIKQFNHQVVIWLIYGYYHMVNDGKSIKFGVISLINHESLVYGDNSWDIELIWLLVT